MGQEQAPIRIELVAVVLPASGSGDASTALAASGAQHTSSRRVSSHPSTPAPHIPRGFRRTSHYPFMAPAMRPRVNARCSRKKKNSAGTQVRVPAAMMLPHSVLNCLTKVNKPRLKVYLSFETRKM